MPRGRTKVTQVWDCGLQCISNQKAAILAGCMQPEDTAVLTLHLYWEGKRLCQSVSLVDLSAMLHCLHYKETKCIFSVNVAIVTTTVI